MSRVLSDRDQKLVEEFVRAVEEGGRAPEEAVAGVEGMSGRNARRYVEEGYRPTRMTQTTRDAMRTVIARIGQDSSQGLVSDPESHDAASDVYLSEDYVRRVCGRLRGQKRSVLAVIQVTEEVHVERGMDVPTWIATVRKEHGL